MNNNVYEQPDRDFYVIDFETLGTKPDCAVVSMAITSGAWGDCTLDRLIEAGQQWVFRIDEQKDVRSIEKDTIAWWKNQSKEARAILLTPDNERISISELQPSIMEYCKQHKPARHAQVFARGQNFDFPILESICTQFGQSVPWDFWRMRDTRTVVDSITGGTYGDVKGYKDMMHAMHGMVKHNALHDVVMDAFLMDALKSRFFFVLAELAADGDNDRGYDWANDVDLRMEIANECVKQHLAF